MIARVYLARITRPQAVPQISFSDAAAADVIVKQDNRCRRNSSHAEQVLLLLLLLPSHPLPAAYSTSPALLLQC